MFRFSKAFVGFALVFAMAAPFTHAAPPAPPAPPGPPGPPTITSSSTTATQLTINGSGFSPGPVSVLPGTFGPMVVTTQTATKLLVTLPAGLTSGDYTLSVQIGPGPANADESVVTIGAAGPAGPTGATGPSGAPGPSGPAGPMGAAGPTGATGPIGTAGWSGHGGHGRARTDGAGRQRRDAGPHGCDSFYIRPSTYLRFTIRNFGVERGRR